MRMFSRLWKDDYGAVLSAEAVVVGTVAVIGLSTGMTVVARSVNEELQDVSCAIRSLDQSYCIPARESCGAMTAGSVFQQQPVEESLKELTEFREELAKEEKTQAERLEQQLNDKLEQPSPEAERP
jgi:hypothetical protein